MSRHAIVVCAVAALLWSAALAFGGGQAMAQSCTVGGTTGSYGTINILAGAAADTTAGFTISCSGTANRTVRLCVEISPGQTNASGNRRLAAGTQRLVHELYSDAARSTVWGSWGLSTTTYTNFPFGITYDLALGASGSASANLTVYGRASANQTGSGPGSYLWTTANAPAAEYDYVGSSSCPTGTKQATSSGSSWTATIDANCLISAGNLNFGSTGVLSGNVDATSTVSVQCTNTTPYNIGLSAGNGSGATVGARKMTNAGKTVVYSLYTDAARSTVWGNTVGTDTASGTGNGSSQTYTVYGRVGAQATPAPGTYSDTIVATITY